MKIFNEGNFAPWLRIGFCIVGGILAYIGLALEILPRGIQIFLFLLGIVFAAVGGYASRAHSLGIKPFDRPYDKARKSYKKEKKD
jgi:hypothetical protein